MENGTDILNQPSYSPDLNSIRRLGFRLKNHVHVVRPNIEGVVGDVGHIQEVLYDALENAWTLTDSKSMEGVKRSTGKRVKVVVDTRG